MQELAAAVNSDAPDIPICCTVSVAPPAFTIVTVCTAGLPVTVPKSSVAGAMS